MASILKRGDSYSVRYKYKDHSGKPCEGWESFKTKKEAQERKITVEKELLDGTFLVPDTMTVEEMQPMGVALSRSVRPCSEPTRTLWKNSTPSRSTTPSQTGVRAASPPSS